MIPDYLKRKDSEIVAQNGEPYLLRAELVPFEEWPASLKLKIQAVIDVDIAARIALDMLGITDEQQRIKKLAYCRCGGFDTKADFSPSGSLNNEYFDCPLRSECPAKVQKMLCRCLPAPNVVLTPREIEIIKLICEDLSDKMIADSLGIAFDTAKNHRRSIEQKTGAFSKSGIVRFAYENGIM